ncbi:endonuclease-8 [Kineococcus xinjiangensis]|uniref:DNA-(apurinic or apyrimidinic site) lyase n=1 Tax=Kineococcus xinjiangensis TaxID=512762 RepID=A0A2S6IVU7_9ACTN|nr:DNA-formamidopyrimidine glycosylase family protein [Kineococcus xinjiangensis]PPK98474.1 endonuclease-8 [Kineococcus xinjiangensis]
MPEGDTVWRTARRLHQALAGRELTGCDLRWPSLAASDLTGWHVGEVVSAGKHLLMRASPPAGSPEPPLTLHSHLRMEGSWHVHRTGQPWATRRAEHGVRAVLTTAEWTAVGHLLGMLDLVPSAEEDRLVGHLGPDLLGPGWDAEEALRRLLAEPDREVGQALLDQRVLAGVGTLYMAEALFLAKTTPWTLVRDLTDPAALIALLHRLLDVNKDRAAQVTTGDLRPGRQHWVHPRSGKPCLRCRGTIRVARLGEPPQDRVAFYCPGCQRGPAPTDDGRRQTPLGHARPRASGPRYR